MHVFYLKEKKKKGVKEGMDFKLIFQFLIFYLSQEIWIP